MTINNDKDRFAIEYIKRMGNTAEQTLKWYDEKEQLKTENEALRDDRDRFRDDLNAMYEWLAVEFPQAFAALKLKVLNPDALLAGKETP